MGILVITVDLDCCRCRAKITKVLESLKDEFGIEKMEFEDKKEKKVVVVRGKFDAEKLCKKVWCKAGNKVVKEIIIVDVWPPPPPPKPEPPKPEPPKPCCVCVCGHCKPKPEHCVCEQCKPKPKEETKKPEEKKPEPAKTQYKFVPVPFPMQPGMCQSWPWQCPPQMQCQCCEKPPQPPPPPPPPPCSCSSHGCGHTQPAWPPYPPVWPPPWAAGCNVVPDENSCSVM